MTGQIAIGPDALGRLEETMRQIVSDCSILRPQAVNLLSGGVDSTYIQAHWNLTRPVGLGPPHSFAVSVDHELTRGDEDYASSAANALGVKHSFVPANEPYIDYLRDEIESTGEPPNHAQSVYFGHLARVMVAAGASVGLCGEGADSLFGVGMLTNLHIARAARAAIPLAAVRGGFANLARLLGRKYLAQAIDLAAHIDDPTDLENPINKVAVFTEQEANLACFGARVVADAFAYRRTLLEVHRIPDDIQDRMHAAGFLGEAVESASLWTTLFNTAGADLLCPFLDSRMLRFAVNLTPRDRYPFRKPKGLLKKALSRHVDPEIVNRRKLGFGQPIFQWMAPGGQLRPMVDAIDHYDFVDKGALATARERPNWFLFSLLCYDVWYKTFITGKTARQTQPRPPVRA